MHARRILVAGASGSGKTTLAARIASASGSPHTEIDALYWRAGWTASESFVDDVQRLVGGDAWVVEFQYREVLATLADRAELLVWLRPPRAVVLWRVVRRTLRRRLRRELLWGVNVEPPLRTFFTDRDHIVRYAVRSLGSTEERIRAAIGVNPGLRIVQVRSSGDVERLLARLAGA